MATRETGTPLAVTLIVSPDDDEDRREDLARQLRRESEEVSGVLEAGLVRAGPAPEGAMDAGTAVVAGQVAIQLLPHVSAVVDLFAKLREWSSRGAGRSVRVKVGDIEIEAPSASLGEATEIAERLLRARGNAAAD